MLRQIRVAAVLAAVAAVALAGTAAAVGPDVFQAEWGNEAPLADGFVTTTCNFSAPSGLVRSYFCGITTATATTPGCEISGQVAGAFVPLMGCTATLSGGWSGTYVDQRVDGAGGTYVETFTCSVGNGSGHLAFNPEPIHLFNLTVSVDLQQSHTAIRKVSHIPNLPPVVFLDPGVVHYAGHYLDAEGRSVTVAGDFQFTCNNGDTNDGFGGTLNFG